MLNDLFWSLNFPQAAILKCDVVALQCQTPTRSLLLFLSRVENGHYNAHTSHFKMTALRKVNDQKKSLGLIYIPRIIKFESSADVDTSWGKLLFEININGSRGSLSPTVMIIYNLGTRHLKQFSLNGQCLKLCEVRRINSAKLLHKIPHSQNTKRKKAKHKVLTDWWQHHFRSFPPG